VRDAWKRAFLGMPSESFLDIMRAYLGGLRTPYRKDELLSQLETSLKKPETADFILSLVDDADAAALGAIAILEGPTRAELIEFLEGDRQEAEALVLNLEERLLVFEDRSQRGAPILRFTPALAEAILDRACEPALLFPAAESHGPANAENPPLDALALASLAAFFANEEWRPVLRADATWKLPVRAARAFAATFPADWNPADAVSLLIALGILLPGAESARIDRQALEGLARGPIPPEARIAAALLPPRPPGEDAEGQGRDILAEAAYIAAQLLPPERFFSDLALRRFIRLSLKRLGANLGVKSETLDILVAAMGRAGLLEGGPGAWSRRREGTTGEDRSISLGADFQVIVRPGISPRDAFRLALFLEPQRLGRVAEFRLTREGAARAFQDGLDSSSILELLGVGPGNEAPQNVAYSLEAWEREHRAVTICEGIVISGDDRLARFMENSPVLRGAVVAALAPGVYLTSFRGEAEAREALKRAGLDTPPRILGGRRSHSHGWLANSREAGPRAEHPRPDPRPIAMGTVSGEGTGRDARVRSRLEALLEKVEEMEAPREIKDALRERVGLKLLLREADLRTESVKRERGEAGGLDYLGKVKLAEKAIHEETWLLSLLYRDQEGKPRRVLMHPARLRKGPRGLLLEGRQVEDGREVSVPIERVSLMKRLRGSIFG